MIKKQDSKIAGKRFLRLLPWYLCKNKENRAIDAPKINAVLLSDMGPSFVMISVFVRITPQEPQGHVGISYHII